MWYSNAMRTLSLAVKAWRLLVLTALAAVCLPAFAVVRYVPVSPTVVAQTADPQPLRRKVSEAPFGAFRTESHPGGQGCGGSEPPLTCSPYTFTGHLYDQESGLYYFGARYYDPETGRFLSQDPVAGDALNPPSLHKYLYAYSSPMNYTDPWGEQVPSLEMRAYREAEVEKLPPEERIRLRKAEAEAAKGIVIDAPVEAAKEAAMFVPNMVKLIGEGTYQSWSDTKKFISDWHSHGMKRAFENQETIVQERNANMCLGVQEAVNDWTHKMQTDPRFMGKESVKIMVGTIFALRGLGELGAAFERRALQSSKRLRAIEKQTAEALQHEGDAASEIAKAGEVADGRPGAGVARTRGVTGSELPLDETPLPDSASNLLQPAGKGRGSFRGGPHARTRLPVGDELDSHHAPAKSVSPLEPDEGPAIQMEKPDHKLTSSYGGTPEAYAYREEIKSLLQQGRWRDAFAMEIKDVRRVAGARYNEAIKEMLDYARDLGLLEKKK